MPEIRNAINNHKQLLGTLATSKQGTEDVTNSAFQVGATDCTVHFIVIFCPLSARKLRRFHSFSQFLPGFGLSYKVIKFLAKEYIQQWLRASTVTRYEWRNY